MEKVWTYVIGNTPSAGEISALERSGKSFVESWTAHDNPLDASFEIVKNRLVVVKVNEAAYAASGCSIDKLTRFIKQAGESLGANLLDRHLVAYDDADGNLQVVHASRIGELLTAGAITPDTPVYDNTVSDSEQLRNWRKPLKETWLNRFLQKA